MDPKYTPALDPAFLPAASWNHNYRKRVEARANSTGVTIALLRPDDSCSVYRTRILPPGVDEMATLRFLERTLKFLLWQRGASEVRIAGFDEAACRLAALYAPNGARRFDYEFFGGKVYGRPLTIRACALESIPRSNELSMPLGRHLDGCRIGFDLGGSDRKCAAVIDGEVVFSEEVPWNPYFESDPEYHLRGIEDSLRRAADHLPRVDAIGGSAAGVYVNNEVRVASLFRGVSDADFEARVRRIFFDLKKDWGGIPLVVVNDGEVTALAGSMSMNENGVLGIAMGTSEAVGYVTPKGNIAPWLNELAFAPVDYRDGAPADEWSGDLGCGVQYFSQQAVARLAPLAGIQLPGDMSFAEQLAAIQDLMAAGDPRAADIYSTIGSYLGYSIAHYADFYEIRKVLLLGRVTTGLGGSIIIDRADEVLNGVFPELSERLEIVTPGEKDKRHGQAVAAASLPRIER